MCLILFAYKAHPQYPLIIAANRDEYYRRKSRKCHWWTDRPSLLAGRDLEGGGTWMGITRGGLFAAITNVRDGDHSGDDHVSRGELPLRFFDSGNKGTSFEHYLKASVKRYRGYNLLFGSPDRLKYFSNRTRRAEDLSPGLHGLSNARLDSPWPKVCRGKQELSRIIEKEDPAPEDIFKLLDSREVPSDEELPDTGIGLEAERMLAPALIEGPDYGTRCSTVVMIDNRGNVRIIEKERAPERGSLVRHYFTISPPP